ncbi:HAD-IIIC family phosphatase [Novacetimonas hansenii]|uniref:HAD-IIIC family phosphatase n=1 Tax=Novacetimonas hansenii TaxID=436 RepID=UPI00068028F7|nr:HAD-IIIC family phosphatase [Novacetimonas hansenii]
MEPVRLVIWDLDETFWNGTLSEGGIHPVEKHITLIKALSERGIVNSICSKNNFGDAEAELKKIGAWEYFIFPQIAFAPKGPMIKAIVEATNLRPETMMFIDDNPMNLNEVLFFIQACRLPILELLATCLKMTGSRANRMQGWIALQGIRCWRKSIKIGRTYRGIISVF